MKNFSSLVESLKRYIYSEYLHYVTVVLIVFLVSVACIPIANSSNYHIVSYVLLLTVSILSTFKTVGPVLAASSLSALVWNYFFIPPNYTFHIEKSEDLWIYSLFLVVVVVNGVLTTRVRKQEQETRLRQKHTDSLFQLTKELSKSSGIHQVIEIGKNEILSSLKIEIEIILQDGTNQLSKNSLESLNLNLQEISMAENCYKNIEIIGNYYQNNHNSRYTFYPLEGNKLNLGILIVKLNQPFHGLEASYWDTFLRVISNVLEREFLAEAAQDVRFLNESDRLYKTIFNSISHEFRIPISTIIGATDSILSDSTLNQIQKELSNEILKASMRLNRLIENLLNISRLESGRLNIRLDWCDINDLIYSLKIELADELENHILKVEIQEDMPLIKIDIGLIEQSLYNLLINALQFTPKNSEVILSFGFAENCLLISVKDSGPGIPKHEIPNVFKKFYKIQNNSTGGLGLGLSIVQGFIEAHNGSISLHNDPMGGAIFVINIPTPTANLKFE